MMKDDIKKVLLSEEELHARVAMLGAQLSRDYAGSTCWCPARAFFYHFLNFCY